jgi:hypothetical protein
MKRALNALISLYPKSWQKRYKNEFLALLDDVSPTWGTLFDVLGGALKMQLKIWSSWKTVAAFGVVGVIAASVYTLTIPKRYVSQAVFRYVDPAKMNSAAEQILSRASLTRLIVEEDLYRGERAREPIEDIIEKMKAQDILIRPVNTPSENFVYSVSFQGPDAARAQRTTQRLTSSFVAANVGTLVDPANLPVHSANPRPSRNMIMGLVLGVLAGTLFALFNGLKVWKLGGSLGLAGLILGAGVAYMLPERYSSMEVIRCSGQGCDRIDNLVFAVMAPANLDAIIARFGLYPNDPGARKKLMENLHFRAGTPGFGAMKIQFDYGDRFIAQKVAADVGSQFIEKAIMDRSIDRAQIQSGGFTVELLDPPSLPWQPTSPNRPVVEGMGLFVGLAAAVGLGVRRHFRFVGAGAA